MSLRHCIEGYATYDKPCDQYGEDKEEQCREYKAKVAAKKNWNSELPKRKPNIPSEMNDRRAGPRASAGGHGVAWSMRAATKALV